MTSRIVFIVAAVLAATLTTFAQCPKIEVYGPSSDLQVGETALFSANVYDGDPKVAPTFRWLISAGKILKGEKDVVLEVDSARLGTSTITATVEVGGFPASCNATASATVYFATPPAARKLDEYSGLKPRDEQARLDIVVIELMNDPMADAYIFAYSTKKGDNKEGAAALKRAFDYLVQERGVDLKRVHIALGGIRKIASIELWIAPQGTPAPTPVPTPDKP